MNPRIRPLNQKNKPNNDKYKWRQKGINKFISQFQHSNIVVFTKGCVFCLVFFFIFGLKI